MNIAFIDDERFVLDSILSEVKDIDYIVSKGFTDPDAALAYADNHNIDMAFIDIDLGKTTGIEVAKQLKKKFSNINLVFLTGFDIYAVEAFQIKAQGYLLKPACRADIENEIMYAIRGVTAKQEQTVEINTFGNFGVFINGKIVKFKRSKTKELFAYLVDRRGASVSTQEAIAVLWEDIPLTKCARSMLHNCIADLNKTLEKFGAQNIVIKNWNSIAVDTSKFYCDYYEFLKGDKNAINKFCGEYMANYSWGEFTLANLDQKLELLYDKVD